MAEEKSVATFEELYNRDIKKYVEKLKKTYKDKKTGQEKSFSLSYLSWAYGHREMKRIDPDATEKVHEFPLIANGNVIEGVKVPYLQTPQGFFVENTVTINGRSETEWLPVLDNSNRPIPNPTSFQINTSNKRCFVKALAKHGLGLYLYVGEDLPEDLSDSPKKEESSDNEADKFSSNKQVVLDRISKLASETGKTTDSLVTYVISSANKNLQRADTQITTHNISQVIGLVKSLEIKAKQIKQRKKAQQQEQQQQGGMLNNMTAQPTPEINWGQPT